MRLSRRTEVTGAALDFGMVPSWRASRYPCTLSSVRAWRYSRAGLPPIDSSRPLSSLRSSASRVLGSGLTSLSGDSGQGEPSGFLDGASCRPPSGCSGLAGWSGLSVARGLGASERGVLRRASLASRGDSGASQAGVGVRSGGVAASSSMAGRCRSRASSLDWRRSHASPRGAEAGCGVGRSTPAEGSESPRARRSRAAIFASTDDASGRVGPAAGGSGRSGPLPGRSRTIGTHRTDMATLAHPDPHRSCILPDRRAAGRAVSPFAVGDGSRARRCGAAGAGGAEGIGMRGCVTAVGG